MGVRFDFLYSKRNSWLVVDFCLVLSREGRQTGPDMLNRPLPEIWLEM